MVLVMGDDVNRVTMRDDGVRRARPSRVDPLKDGETTAPLKNDGDPDGRSVVGIEVRLESKVVCWPET